MSTSTTDCQCLINPPQSVISNTFGALVMGLMIQQFFWGMIAVQASHYYTRFGGREEKFYLYLVGVLLALNALEGGMDLHVIYRTAVVHFGNYGYFDLQTWTMWAEPGALVGCLAQVFFMERCWKITNRSRTVFVALFILLSLGSGITVSVSFFQVKFFSKLAKIPIPITFWLVSTAVTDLTIASILCFELYRSKTSIRKTGAVINKLITLTVETSAVTAFIAVLNLILHVTHHTTCSLYPQFSICRVYTITVLVTLLKRDDLRQAFDGHTYCSSFVLTGVPTQDCTVNRVEVKVCIMSE
ncbi:hypothetical protein DFH07DRAFT_738244 [Mycena maculata]|uniref:DUF6534 domain-containing protein n=1 Tax=Mycena maculata TaxID=230809 RepID=A0AAD7JH04_9AGAR|nr:hypothetical protein DFH07DRAFT_738244 [Mycena maculata]